jgi:hypothetical protein
MNGLPNTVDEVERLDLNFIEQWERDMIIDGMRAVVRANNKLKNREINAWNYLAKFSPPTNKGFMFCDDEIVSIIQGEMETGHSGSSMAWTMRILELIAKEGSPALNAYFNKQGHS